MGNSVLFCLKKLDDLILVSITTKRIESKVLLAYFSKSPPRFILYPILDLGIICLIGEIKTLKVAPLWPSIQLLLFLTLRFRRV